MLRSACFHLLLAVGAGVMLQAAAPQRLSAAEGDDNGQAAVDAGNAALANAKAVMAKTQAAENFTGPKSPLDVIQNQPYDVDPAHPVQRTEVHSTFQGEPDPRDFHIEKFQPWSLNAKDFTYEKPRLVIFQDGDEIVQLYVALSYTITNSTTRNLRIKPNFTMLAGHYYTKPAKDQSFDLRFLNNVRNYVKVVPAVDGVPALSQEDFDKYSDTRLEKLLGWSQYSNLTPDYNTIMMHYQMVRDLKGDPAKGDNWDITAYDYKPGEVKHGIALFPLEDPNMETMRILVDGLTNEHYFNHATFDNFYQQLQDPNYAMYNPPESWPHTLRRVLDLRFKRTANTGFEMGNTTFDFISQHWDKVWDPLADMQILSDMPKPEMMDGFYPDAAKHPLWHVQWKITNNTNQVQLIRFDKMYYNVKINLDLSGTNLKHEGTIPVWVRVVDDGNMSIFKEKYLKEHPELTGSADDRTYYDRYHFYPEKNDELDKQPREFRDLIELQPTTPETRGQETPQTTRSSVSVFDAQDIDWDNVFLQVTIALSRDIKNPKETIGSVMRNFPNPKDAKGALLAKELAEAGRLSYNPKFTFAGMNGGDPQKDIDDVKKLVYDAVVKAVTDGASASTAGTKCINLSLATTQLGPKEPDQFEAFKNADPLGQYIGAGLETNTFFLTKRTPVDLHDVLNERDKPDASLGGETGP